MLDKKLSQICRISITLDHKVTICFLGHLYFMNVNTFEKPTICTFELVKSFNATLEKF